MLKDLFHKKKKYATIKLYEDKKEDKKEDIKEESAPIKKKEKDIDSDLWTKCKSCGEIILTSDVDKNLKVCPECGYHFRMRARERISAILDKDSFIEFDKNMESSNPLSFPDYEKKMDRAKGKSSLLEAVVTGEGKIEGNSCIICVMDPYFMMGSMGSVVGEKITRAIEKALERELPLIIFTASGGARMQEGILSLMQMAKTSAALGRLSQKGIPYITVLTDPTTGGVTASFAMLGDMILAEPEALIGFAGPRVIEQTIKQKLPEGFQRSEFLKEKGFVDKIVKRQELRDVLGKILYIHSLGGSNHA
ncbi:acetyl-CoA carboxylase, carboxyltransferase subunit beta [Thermohalobacter berrensis]|uniref:Acetyl-coenzyme A carboxylase carboxyl transferase subunit beta n=1 Tax=Thermohalobacter berrensis TaxID=99594 RepID=A0A419T8Y1_9FIRM|nr:acetyl-CoA carboxylase, carboxyltransferase subunit beta [Thermohalobacter berrensis]RKD33908.1 acetyl-CoA carboxylase subunit beta [Thermohalobacter berrensis]